MLEPNSVDQIVRVLDLFRQNKRLGFASGAACSRAIQQVAKESDVRYQTIGDGCRRRLGLVDMNEFHRLAEDWLSGDAAPLISVLKKNSERSAHSRIDAFFSSSMATRSHNPGPGGAPGRVTLGEAESPAVTVKLEEADARMLRVLAQLEAREPDTLAIELLRATVRDRLRSALA